MGNVMNGSSAATPKGRASTQQQASSLELPARLCAKLEGFRRRLRTIKLAEAILAATLGLLLCFLTVFVCDRLGDTPAWARSVFLGVGAAGLVVWLPRQWHRWVWQTRQLEQVARLLRHTFPRLGDQLLGVVELVHGGFEQDRSPALCRAALRQVDEAASSQEFHAAVPHPRHRQWAWAVGGTLAIALIASLFAPAACANALARWLFPWNRIDRYTFVQLERLPGQLIVPYAEPFALVVSLSETTAWKPLQASACYGQQMPVPTERVADRYAFELPPQTEADALAIQVGDVRRQIWVQPTTRPELVSMIARARLPEYLGQPAEQTKDVRGGSVSFVKGSRTVFEATANRELAEATLDGVAQPVRGDRLITSPCEVVEPASHQFLWRDHSGLSAREPFVVTVNPLDDEPPSVSARDFPREQIVLDEEVLSFQALAKDDFGVKTIGLEWLGVVDPVRNPKPVRGEAVMAGGAAGQRDLQALGTFSAKAQGVAAQTLQLRLYAVDYLPGRQRAYSPTYVLHVLNAQDHAVWLTLELRHWFRQAQEVHERERQLHQTNRELHQLPPAELDHPENRRRVERQAAAEWENARQLSALSSAGHALIGEAIRNSHFQAATLETWAEILRTLEEVAASRMPSVASLLEQAAAARGATARSVPKEGPPAAPKASAPPHVGTDRDGRSMPGASAPAKRQRQAPRVSDVESGFNRLDNKQTPNKPSPSGAGRLTLPGTLVQGGGSSRPQKNQKAQSPAKQKLEEAVNEQANLLAEFAKVAEEMQKTLDELEGSTFVKRLKAAARRQLEIAADLAQHLLGEFGLRADALDDPLHKRATLLAERQVTQSENLSTIEEDLQAYYLRLKEPALQLVLEEMSRTDAVQELRGIAERLRGNLSGRALAETEYWADTLDRWAEQLVGPGRPSSSSSESKGDSVPPSVVLELLRILRREVELREQTRAVEQARSALEQDEYQRRAKPLAETQQGLTKRIVDATKQLEKLSSKLTNEIELLERVEEVMREACGLLARPETGPQVIAAETEVIELLLQAQRGKGKPKSARKKGFSPGDGRRGNKRPSALALLDTGVTDATVSEAREVRQVTGSSGREFPPEFRSGLDAYFGALEKSRANRAVSASPAGQ